jgi:hypothetical protein
LLGIILICGLEGLECRFLFNWEAGKHRLWFHKQSKFQGCVSTEDEMLDQLTVLFLTQSSLGFSPVASTHVGFRVIVGLDGSVLPWQYQVLLGEGLMFYLVKSQVSPWGSPIPVRDLGRGTASSFWLKRDLCSLGDDGWN